MVMIKQLLWMRHEEGKSDYKIGKILGISKNTVKAYYDAFCESGLVYEEVSKLDEEEVYELFCAPKKEWNNRHEKLMSLLPDILNELKRPGVDRHVLWVEYREQYPDGYGYSQFCYYLSGAKKPSEASLLLDHKAGETMFVDFTGKKMYILDRKTGKKKAGEVFVAILPCSQITYVEVVNSQRLADFIDVTGNALHFFGGVPVAIIPDNLKSAITKPDRYEAEKNRNYVRFGEHYKTTIFPARPNTPKDKAYVEGVVKIIYRRIFAPLRNREFYSFEELNQAIRELLEKHNNTQLTGRSESRRELFEHIEKPYLKPLPDTNYEIKKFETKRVNKFYIIQLHEDKRWYSIPYQYIGEKVEIIYSNKSVEIFCKNKRIAWHKRQYEKDYVILKEHMPPQHQAYHSWNKETILESAAKIGPETATYCEHLLNSKKYLMEGLRSCLGILALSKESAYGAERVNNACKRGLQFQSYSLTVIRSILQKGLEDHAEPEKDYSLPQHDNIRSDFM